MELDITQLYSHSSWVHTEARLTAAEQKAILEKALSYGKSMGIEGVDCRLEKSTARKLLRWTSSRALVLSAELDDLPFQGIITLHTYGAAAAVGTYKELLGVELFAVNHSLETRRRALMQHLVKVEAMDYFAVVDKAVSEVGDFVVEAIQELIAADS